MEVIREIHTLRKFLDKRRIEGKSIGLVPTMGALHAGHLKLVESSVNETDVTVCSIFVNPTQFNNPNDLKHYPRNFEEDLFKLDTTGCHVVFCPPEKEVYKKQTYITFKFGYLEEIMEGKFRPGHFNGVGLIVCKLFNIIEPDYAYFGQKDLQQFALINLLVEELNFDINLRCIKTVREKDGLAMSSRNQRLNTDQRKTSVIFYNALKEAEDSLKNGHSVSKVKKNIFEKFDSNNKVKLEYFEIVDSTTLLAIDNIKKHSNVSLCIAGYIGNIRLIDNLSLF